MASPPPRNRRAVAAAAGNTVDGAPARATRTRTSSSRRELVMSEILEHATRLLSYPEGTGPLTTTPHRALQMVRENLDYLERFLGP